MISIIVPCYNEEATLPLLYKKLNAIISSIGCPYEVICIDDGSADSTWNILCEFHAINPNWLSLKFTRNFGHQNAIASGLYFSRGECAIILDADLQDPPEIIIDFINKWQSGYDIVYAIRQKRKESLPMKFLYFIFYRLLNLLSEITIPNDSGDFCLVDRKVINFLNHSPERNIFLRGLRAWSGYKQIGIEYERNARIAGHSKYSFVKLFKLAGDGIISFSTIPLRLATFLGLFVSCVSFLSLICLVFLKILGLDFSPKGWTSLVTIQSTFGGLVLLCLGIIGEYVGRIYKEILQRPHWIVFSTNGIPLENPFGKYRHDLS